MPSKADRERLLRIISLCIDVERRGANPFEVEVKEILNTLKKFLPHWKALEDFVLDAEALNRIASVVHLQGDWIKHRSTSLYVDPLLIELKIKMIDAGRLVDMFVEAWHPIVEFEGLSKRRVDEAVDYWNQLPPLEERRISLPAPVDSLGYTSLEELLKLRLVSEKSFNEALQSLWEELKGMVGGRDQIPYWAFIQADTYEETIYRAYMTSFLVTYGYASMVVDPIEEEAFLIPYDERRETASNTQSVSIPIAIDYEMWRRVRGRKLE